MKSIFFTLPLLAAMASARAIAAPADADCLPCLKPNSTGLPQAPAPVPVPVPALTPPVKVPAASPQLEQITKDIKGVVDCMPNADGIASSIAKQVVDSGDFDIASVIDQLVAGSAGQARSDKPIDIGSMINQIIKIVQGLFGTARTGLDSSVDVGEITNIVLSSVEGDMDSTARSGAGIGAIIKTIIGLISGGQGAGGITNIISKILGMFTGGQGGGINIGTLITKLIGLITGKGGLSRRQNNSVDIAKLIQAIVGLFGKNGAIDLPKLIETIIGLIPKN
ncbi:hypothetical protein LOZ39_005880 [Ophidiomyces ophidiicola]|uniref:Uncharacterized protein n=1 Tax=Ophidiomyces ophidiicola TaxID=1387563 RepID=A0ACB8V1B5_9EURO|nr:hypothetical protein LOZ64_004409 [Ophidiomyces ophidiicola]KAI1914658.1 hypothetical protein LOZ61_002059 [Ophidiomyces ophidiicola]KAI1930882.1 hypothetical protein LOZ60_000542 [Ophidiomyces ophidiicola]KAI1962151.1 hypothetical protein LOZ59_002185 [Ophidiomyces ophidiicola]KAI1967518.1 hypothetical protein LOZ56_005552 [Ophidiomyces ophidiicola]